jgi:hypothetical protein
MALRRAKCVVAYSNSYRIAKDGLAAHLFFMLDTPAPSDILKRILTNVNMLSKTIHGWLMKQPIPDGKTDLPLPIDPTMGQNNRIIYNAPPRVVGIDDPLPNISDRIFLYTPKVDDPTETLNVNHFSFAPFRRVSSGEAILLEMRKKRGLSTPTRINGRSVDVEPAADEWVISDLQRDSDEFMRCNVNGTARSPWFFKNAPLEKTSLMYSQNPADLPFIILSKAPSFFTKWNGTDDALGIWAIQELEIACSHISDADIIAGAVREKPAFMIKQ